MWIWSLFYIITTSWRGQDGLLGFAMADKAALSGRRTLSALCRWTTAPFGLCSGVPPSLSTACRPASRACFRPAARVPAASLPPNPVSRFLCRALFPAHLRLRVLELRLCKLAHMGARDRLWKIAVAIRREMDSVLDRTQRHTAGGGSLVQGQVSRLKRSETKPPLVWLEKESLAQFSIILIILSSPSTLSNS